MRGFTAFLSKEFVETIRTWRLFALPGIVLFFAVSGPPLAMLTPELLASVAGSQPGVIIAFPEPTYVDAYAQWVKNLSQIVVFAVVIVFGGVVSTEVRAGTAALVLTKPISRTAFVLAKFAASLAFVTAVVVIGALVTWGVTHAVFAEAPLGVLASATGAWLAFGAMLVAIMTLLSVTVRSQAGAAGLGLGVYLVLALATMWGPALRYTPAGLVNAPAEVLMGADIALGWPIATAAAVSVASVTAAVMAFRRAEL